MNKFNFGKFLLENGFSYTNTGANGQYYHIDREGTEHRLNLRENDFIHTKPEFPKFERTIKNPTSKTLALKTIKSF